MLRSTNSLGSPATKIALIENGLDLGEFEDLPPTGTFRMKQGLGEKKIIAYLGRIFST